MWLIAEYEPVTLFSLKQSSATASGGKTLLIPTPFTIKMALLDAACRTLGVQQAEQLWPQIRDLQIALQPPQRAVINNLFQKVLRPRRNAIALNEPDAGPFQKSIGYREYVQYAGVFLLGLGWQAGAEHHWLLELLLNVNYFGKRGSFVQLIKPPNLTAELPQELTIIGGEQQMFDLNGTLQVLDDCSTKLTFDQVNIYSDGRISIGKDRLLRPIILPYRVARSSRGYTLYERID